MEIKILENAVSVSEFVAAKILEKVLKNSQINLGLATGRTMDAIYHNLVKQSVRSEADYSSVKAFAVDEYVGLPQNSENSFEHYLHRHLFNQLNFRKENIFIPKTERACIDDSCFEFEQTIKKEGGINLQLLGIGRNGHIGLNEPGSSLDSRTRIVALTSSTYRSNKTLLKNEDMPSTAVTMGIGTILDSDECFLVATGQTKAEIVQKVVHGDIHSKLPATAVKAHKNALLILDKEAARLI